MKLQNKIGPNGELYDPTIKAAENFDAYADIEAIREAMKGSGTNEDLLMSTIVHRSYEQRKEIMKAYRTLGRELEDDIKSEVHGNFRKALISLLKSPGEIMAIGCHEAMAGAGTDEKLLAEIIGAATNEEITDMKQAYSTLYGKDLIEEVRSECKGNFEHTLIAMLQAARVEPSESDMKAFQKSGVSALVDMAKAEDIAQKLYDAGEGKWGTDETTFVAILCRQSVWMIAAIDMSYNKKFNKSIIEAIKSEFSGEDKDIMVAIARSCLDRTGLYAKMLHESLDGAGTNEAKLIRILCARAEIDLGTIKKVYEETYGESLKKAIMSDLSGDFEKVMVAILGEE